MSKIKQRVHKDAEEGFTLIELMVVVLILGILMAIAIPTFLSLTNNAKKNAAQADLTTAVTDAAVYFTANGTYGASTDEVVKNLTQGDGNINWVNDDGGQASATAGTKQVLVASDSKDGSAINLGTLDKNGDYYWVHDDQGTTTYAPAQKDPSIPGDDAFTLQSLP